MNFKDQHISLISVLCVIMSVIMLFGCCQNNQAVTQHSPSLSQEPTSALTKTPTITQDPSTPSPSPTPIIFSKNITSFVVRKADNKSIDEDLTWSILDDNIMLSVSYLFDLSSLVNCIATINFSDGTFVREKLNLSLDNQPYLVIDDNGVEKKYEIITNRITYNLPVFYIEIENNAEVTSRENYLNATIKIDSSGCKYATFKNLQETPILIRGRGHYSWTHPKTPYKIRFEDKTSVLGMSASKNWVLIANYVDRSLLQNYVAMEMGKVMDYIPYHTNQYPVDVFVNGTYRGVYTFGEQLEVKKERINLEQGNQEEDTDYLLDFAGTDNGNVLGKDYFNSIVLKNITIRHPDKADITTQQIDYILSYLRKADTAVKNLSNYEDYIDINSLIDWVILHELTYNLDCCFRRSCYLIKEKGGKLKMGPIWDFDLGFGSFYRYKRDTWATVGSDGAYVPVTWMNYLMKDEAFMKKFTDRWNAIKDVLLNTALECIDKMSVLVAPSAEYNFKVWDILGKELKSQPTAHKKYDTYEKMIGRLKTFLINRYKWIDEQLKK